MYNKIFLTIIMCLVLTATRAQTTISVGCTMPPCFPCLASFTGSWSSSDNTIAGVDPSTGYITGVGGGTAIITFTYNVASCGTGVFTSTVNVIPSFIVTGVDETAPILIPGERDYTYCASGGLTLNVNTIPAVLPGATYTWDDGVTIATTLSSPVYSPTYTPTGSTVVHTYTVTVVQGSTVSCSATAIVRVVVPATGCSPCDYFNVNAYRTLDGLATIPLGTCPDCSTLQPFHTITAPALDMTNTVDNANYYVVHNASLDKPNYNRDNFFMNGGVSLSVSAISNVTIAGSHLFSALQCQWNGINVAVTSSSAGSLNIVNDCLIENAGNGGTAGVNINGTGSTSFFMPGMHQILFSYGSVYNSNGGDINIQNYSPTIMVAPVGSQLPFTMQNNTFTNRDFADGTVPFGGSSSSNYPFFWPSSSTLNTQTTPVPDPGFKLDVYTARGITLTSGHHGIYMSNVGNYTTLIPGGGLVPDVYGYNYAYIGMPTPDPSFNLTNVFDNVQFGAQLQASNAFAYNNTFRHMGLQGIELLSNTQNDVEIVGNAPDHTNNRFYHIYNYGVHAEAGTPYDFTCLNGEFSSTTNFPSIGVYLVLAAPAQHNMYTIAGNYIYNYSNGIEIQYSGGVATGMLNGFANIAGNNIVGKTAPGGLELTYIGIQVQDLRAYSGLAANGYANIIGNMIQGVQNGILFESPSLGSNIQQNTINVYNYSGVGQYGITNFSSPYMTSVQSNVVGGFGYNCTPATTGIICDGIGTPGNSVNVSCNAVHDLNTGFSFSNVSTLQWTDNQMMRNQTGMFLASNGNIGTQGAVCQPTDNHWDNGFCSICVPGTCSDWPLLGWSDPTVYQTYVDGPAGNALSSKLYVRTLPANYDPTNNGFGVGATGYVAGVSVIDASIGCGGGLPPLPGCAMYAGFKPAHHTVSSTVATTYAIFPNPSDGNLTITQSTPSTAPVNVMVYNTLGQKVYSGALHFENGKTNIKLDHAVPGMYQVTLSGSDGEISNNKIVIEKQQ